MLDELGLEDEKTIYTNEFPLIDDFRRVYKPSETLLEWYIRNMTGDNELEIILRDRETVRCPINMGFYTQAYMDAFIGDIRNLFRMYWSWRYGNDKDIEVMEFIIGFLPRIKEWGKYWIEVHDKKTQQI